MKTSLRCLRNLARQPSHWRTGLSLCVFALFGSSVYGSININVDAVQKAVVFLYGADAAGSLDASKPLGTGFLVEIPLNADPSRAYKVLVTARHMLDPSWAQCAQANPKIIYARLNKKHFKPESTGSGVDFVRIELVNGTKQLWRHHTNDHADAAVLPLGMNLEKFDIAAIPVGLFPTNEEVASQSIGDPIMSAGLLPGLTGSRRNYPIFKFGQISSIPQEDVETSCSPDRPRFAVQVWLVAANLVPGNSGSPMFHVPLGGSGVSFGGTRPMLLGIQSISFLGADVAGMTPISYVYDILKDFALPDANLNRGVPHLPSK